MPYSRKYSKANKSNGYKKRSYRRGALTAKRVASIARTVVRKEKTPKEIRFHTFGGLKTDVLANSFVITDITNIAPGSAADQRDGRKILMSGCRYSLAFDNARGEERYVRIMALQPKNVNDPPDLTTWTDLYQDNNYGNRTADMLVGDITHPINRDVYHIFMDKLIKLSAAGTDTNAKVISGYLRLNRRLEYDDDGASANVPVTGGQILFIVHIAENYSTSGTTATVTNYDGFYRVFFKE